MAKMRPAGSFRQLSQFGKRKGPRRRHSAVEFRHRIAEQRSGEQENAGTGQQSTPQISDQNSTTRQLTRVPKDGHRIVLAKVMENKRAENDVVTFPAFPCANVTGMKA